MDSNSLFNCRMMRVAEAPRIILGYGNYNIFYKLLIDGSTSQKKFRREITAQAKEDVVSLHKLIAHGERWCKEIEVRIRSVLLSYPTLFGKWYCTVKNV